MEMVKFNKEKVEFLQFSIVENCNFNCKGCIAFSNLAEEKIVSIEDFTKDVVKISSIMNDEEKILVITGGEPFLLNNLFDYVQVLNLYFPKGIVYILTNGSLLESKNESFYNLIRETKSHIRVNNYLDEENMVRVTNFLTEKNVDYDVRNFGDFWSLQIGQEKSWNGDINYKTCKLRSYTTIKNGKVYHCPVVANKDILNKYFNLMFEDDILDSIEIDNLTSEQDLLDFIQANKTGSFCDYCNIMKMKEKGMVPHGTSQKIKEEWLEEEY